jgi:hypothetical protein
MESGHRSMHSTLIAKVLTLPATCVLARNSFQPLAYLPTFGNNKSANA